MRRVASLFGGKNGRGWTALTASTALNYYNFEHLLWSQIKKRIRAGDYDVVHRITPLSPTVPSLLARHCRRAGVPFVLGPLNGGVPWPKGFDTARRREHEWLSYLRGCYRLLPGYRSTRNHAALIVVGSRDTLQQMPAQHHHKCVYIPENAVDPARFTMQRTRHVELPLRVVFVGRLVPYIGAVMLMEAAAPLLKCGMLRLDILGDGPQMGILKAMVERDGLGDFVRLAGWVKHDELQTSLVEADVLPSIREFGAVALEAMAVGVPPIVINYGGPGELVTPETGFLLPIGPREQIVSDLRKVLSEICRNPEIVDMRSEPARRRVRELFTWQAKAKKVVEEYMKLVKVTPNRCGDSPFFDTTKINARKD